jgi:hypothetical protein
VTIANTNVQGPGDLIYGLNSDLILVNTNGVGTNPNQAGVRKGRFLHMENVVNLLMANCNITGAGYPVYLNRYAGNHTSSQTIRIYNNQFVNVDARPSDGKNGYQTSGNGTTHAILLNAQYAVPYIEIAWNQIVNTPYVSDCSDIINMYDSSGTATSHLLIHDNYAQGAYSITPGKETYTGGGIIVDGNTTDTLQTTPAFIDIYNNQVVSTSNYGVSIAAGHDNRMFDNRIISSGYLVNGVFHSMYFGNGINNYNNYNLPATVFFNNYTSNNFAGLIRPDKATGQPMRSDWYLPGQSDNGNNAQFAPVNSSNPTLTDEANEWAIWKKKVAYWRAHEGLKFNKIDIRKLRA